MYIITINGRFKTPTRTSAEFPDAAQYASASNVIRDALALNGRVEVIKNYGQDNELTIFKADMYMGKEVSAPMQLSIFAL